MDVQIEKVIVVRMTRLDAARTLVAPGEFQTALRAQLDAISQDDSIEGKVVTPALEDGNHTAPVIAKREPPSPRVKRIMRQYKKRAKTTACPHGCGNFKRLGLHMTKAHGARAAQSASVNNEGNGDGQPEAN